MAISYNRDPVRLARSNGYDTPVRRYVLPMTNTVDGSVIGAARDYPALDGRVVTERHARVCRTNGHATHTVDGVIAAHCPRCGDVR